MPLSKIWLPNGNKRIPFIIARIVYFLASNQYAVVYYLDANNVLQTYTITTSLIKLERKLIQNDFLRANKSVLANINYITEFITTGKGKITVPEANCDFELHKQGRATLIKITQV